MCQLKPSELTDEEEKAIKSINRLAKKWPETLWLFAGSSTGSITIMKYKEDGSCAICSNDCVDPNFIVGSASIPNDGGDF
jgi:hypothetical protein